MVTVKLLHCAQRPGMMIYSGNMITWKSNYNVFSNPKECSHSSMVRYNKKLLKYNN